jgi:RNA polymerase sigma factor (sigma-70 family)
VQALNDSQLLREYAIRGSEAAFEALVVRHVNLVYSAALRRVRDPVLAGEITQTVFLLLSRKGRSLSGQTIVSGWLYRTTLLVATRALRADFRRRKREQEAMQMQSDEAAQDWQEIAPLLDEAMDRLCSMDRNAIVLRFFENKSLRDVGVALGTNEGAAQKRVARAIDKLRTFLHQRGVVMPVVTLGATLSVNAVQSAPAQVAAMTMASLNAAAATSTTNLLKGTLKVMAWTKLKVAAVASAVGLLAIGGSGFLTVSVIHLCRDSRPPQFVTVPAGSSNSVSVLLGAFHTNEAQAVTVDVKIRNRTVEPLEFGYGVQIKVPEGWAHTNGNVQQFLTTSPDDDILQPLSDRIIPVEVPDPAALWRVLVLTTDYINGEVARGQKPKIYYSREVARR